MTAWLLTWLWQGIAVAAGVSIAFRLLPRVNAATRYAIWWTALVALVWVGWPSNDNLSGFGIWDLEFNLSRVQGESRFPTPESPLIQIQALPSWVLTALMTVWLTVALIKLCCILSGLQRLYELNDRCRPFPLAIEDQLPLWQEARASGRRVRLMLCDKLAGAAVLGLDRPCIALPSSLLGALTVDELDQIILHEYAHVQRRDDWMRLIQTLIESALWIHPATFWIGRGLNLEREVVCDDWVIARTGSPKTYARCLSRAAEVRGRVVQRVFAPAFFGGPRDLLRRVDRLLDTNRSRRRRLSTAVASVGVCSLALISVQLRAFPLIGEHVPISARLEPDATTDGGHRGSRLQTPDFRPEVRQRPEAGARSPEPRPRAVRLRTNTARGLVQVGSGLQDVWPEARQGQESGARSLKPEPKTDAVVDGRIAPLLDARSFQGVYRTPESDPITLDREESNTWQLAGTAFAKASASAEATADKTAVKTASAKATAVKTAGVGIGSAAKKASVGFASAFTRAGVSLARSFY
jgi:beta-lactamase regulating signal transducer with metallopeptidase domain